MHNPYHNICIIPTITYPHQCLIPTITYPYHNICIIPTITYASKLKTFQRNGENTIWATKMKLLGVRWGKKWTSVSIRGVIKLLNILSRINDCKWRWTGHVTRMSRNHTWHGYMRDWMPPEREDEEGPGNDGRMTSDCMQNQIGLRRQQTDNGGRIWGRPYIQQWSCRLTMSMSKVMTPND